VAAAITLTIVVGLDGCGRTEPTARDSLLTIPVPGQVRLHATTVTGFGSVVADSRGETLYMFAPDVKRRVTCTGPCAGTWPPLVIADGHQPTAGPGLDPAYLGTLPDPNTGARIVTYGGYPLYRYAGDIGPGTADGQDLFLNGGPWYVLDPQARPITTPNRASS
jgi:predicted lipoprotein with Yx(FWY)xxD motif